MKNTDKYSLKKCIFMTLDSFKELVLELTNGLKKVQYELDGIYFEDTDEAEESETYWNEYMTDTLSKYFDVQVTSIHTDDCEVLGVWICYKE